MATKFCRALIFNGAGNTVSGARASYLMKMWYEFWGFCINGTNSLTTPGGFASTSPFGGSLPGDFQGIQTTISLSSHGVSLPQSTVNVSSTTGFPNSGTIYVYTDQGTQTVSYTGISGATFTGCSGGTGTMSLNNNVTSASLPTLGSDGYTNATTIFRNDGYQDFYAASSIPFTSNMVGKQLVVWKNNSGSSEDSIYNIIGFKSNNNIVVNVNNGGTPSAPDGYKPSFTSRSGINYRVIDMSPSSINTGVPDGAYMVMQFEPTGINAGQANSQVQIITSTGNNRLDFKISPAGTWNGTAFTDGTGQIAANFAAQANFFNGQQGGGTMGVTLIGDKSFLLGHFKDANNSQGTGNHFHIEIPDRLYSVGQDTNPITVNINGYSGGGYINSTSAGSGYGGGFVMKCNDAVGRNYRTTVKALSGDGNADRSLSIAQIPGNALGDFRAGANQFTGTLVNSYGYLTLPGVVGQFSLARCRLRNVRFCNTFMTQFTRFASNGDFVIVGQGVAWPWDKTVLPFTLFPI